MNEKMGVRFGIILGNVGLAGCVASMLIATSLPASSGPVVFLVLNTLSNITFPTVPLNLLQCLLQVVPEKNKTLSISIYTMFISLSNAFMPMAGVAVYTALGETCRLTGPRFGSFYACGSYRRVCGRCAGICSAGRQNSRDRSESRGRHGCTLLSVSSGDQVCPESVASGSGPGCPGCGAMICPQLPRGTVSGCVRYAMRRSAATSVFICFTIP